MLKRVLDQFSAKKLQYRYRQLRNYMIPSRQLWEQGIHEEIDHWQKALTDPNAPTYNLVRQRLDPQRPLDPRFRELLQTPPGHRARILDIGSGPLTIMGYVWEDRQVDLHMIDALADEYNKIMAQAGIVPPVSPIQCHAEEIAQQFEPNSFDLIHSFNALDHAYAPLEALKQAMTLLKPGGWIYLRHKVNEGKRIYGGLHQWNFCEENGQFIIWNMRERFVAREHLTPLAQAQVRTWVSQGIPHVDGLFQKTF